MLALESRQPRGVRLQIDELVGNQREHDAVGIKPGAAEHAAHVHGAELAEHFADMRGVHGRPRQLVPAASFAGVSCTDSPQPQADVWFGLLNTNCADNFSVL